MDKVNLFKKLMLVATCSGALFLNQNCGGNIFSSSNLMSKNHRPSDLGDANKASYKPRMGDRSYIASTMASIFFPEGAVSRSNPEISKVHKSLQDYVSSDFTARDVRVYNIIRDSILKNVDEFKGPCSVYEKDALCNGMNPNHVEIDVVGLGSVSREGLRVSACYQILDEDRAVQNVMNRVSKTYSTSRINNEKVRDVFNLFYPGIDLDQNAHRSLASLAEETLGNTKSNLEAWRMVLLSVCQTGTWQIP